MTQAIEHTAPYQESFTDEPGVENSDSYEESKRTSRALGAFAVMSINMNGQPSWYPDEPKKQWSTRAPLVKEIIEGELPEIIGVQEFGETTEEDVFNSWEESPYALYKGHPVNDIFINPILWNTSRFTVRDQLTHWLTPDGKFRKAWGGIERGYSATLLEDRSSSQPIWVYNAHLDNVSALARLEGMKKMLGDIDERADNSAVIIAGDLNTATWPVPYIPSEGYYDPKVPASAKSDQELFKHLEAAGFVDTNPERHTQSDLSKPTFHAYLGEEIYRQPDKFGVWNPDAIYVRNLGTLAFKVITTSRDGVYPSDHYPIKATVSETV